MKERSSSIKSKANEMKVKAWKLLLKKAFEGETEALKAIIELAEPIEEAQNEW